MHIMKVHPIPGSFATHLFCAVAILGNLLVPCRAEETILLGSLDVSLATQGWASPVANQSINKTPLLIAGQKFASGLGTHAVSLLYVDLQGGTRRLTASVGVDDEAKPDAGSVEFHVYGDGIVVWRITTGPMSTLTTAGPCRATTCAIRMGKSPATASFPI